MQNYIKIIRAVLRYGQKSTKNASKMGGYPNLRPPRFFFPKLGSVTFVPSWCLNFMQNFEKSLERSLRYLKTDALTEGHGCLHRTPSGKLGVQNDSEIVESDPLCSYGRWGTLYTYIY